MEERINFYFNEVLEQFRNEKKLTGKDVRWAPLIQNATKKWTMPVWNRSLTLSQLAIFFEGRLDSELKI